MRALLGLALLLTTLGLPSRGSAVALVPGDLVVSGTPVAETAEGLYRVDPTTAAYELLSAGHFRDHAVDPIGAIFAIEDDAVVRIDPATGIKAPVDGGTGLGTLEGVAVDGAGFVYLTAIEPGGSEIRVLRLDPGSGDASPLASGGYLSGGTGFTLPFDLELASDGAPLVLMTGVFHSLASIVRIEPDDGSQTLLTDDSDLLATAVGLGVAPDGSLAVTADGFALCDCVALVDLLTGDITGGSLRILIDGVPQATASASDIGVGLDGRMWLLAYVGAPVGPGLFRWDERPQLEDGGGPFLPMSGDSLGDVQVVLAICGDGEPGGLEECDDGNLEAGDGCSHTCLAEVCGNERVDAGETCDDGNTSSGDGCDANCTETDCGNGVATEGEECDDGNLASGDGCDANCTATGCGNGVVSEGEACDDADAIDDNGCNRSCRVDFGEQTKGQRQCIQGVNRGIDRLARIRLSANEHCLDDAAAGRLGGDPAAFDLCLGTAANGKRLRAERWLAALEDETCEPKPPELALGSDRLAGVPAASALPSELVRDLLGNPATAAPRNDRAAASCQEKVLRQANDLFAAVWVEVQDATGDKLAGRGTDAAVSDEELTAHVSQVLAGSRAIGKAADALQTRTAAACAAVTGLVTLFPGCEAADVAALGECAERSARCRACLLVREADPGVALDCELFDDRVDDESCPPAP